MMRFIALGVALCMVAFATAFAQTPAPPDTTKHKIQFVTVEKDVRLEVVDWGGNGPPLLFLAGGGNTAHALDKFAPRFTTTHHVYGITRRGVGASSKPPPTVENYATDRLGDDVLAVMTALRLEKPVLAGHSLGGAEMSSIGTRHPERVSGLIYLDAAYYYAFHVPGAQNFYVDALTVSRDLDRLKLVNPAEGRAIVQEIERVLPDLQRGLRWYRDALEGQPDTPAAEMQTERWRIKNAVFSGLQKYTGVKPPILAIFAMPQKCESNCDTVVHKRLAAAELAHVEGFAAAYPSARVVKLANADHYVFESNPDDVQREMNAFMNGLN